MVELQEDREQIEIFVSCRSLRDMDVFSKSDPLVIMYQYKRTEIIWDNLNPNFVKTFIVDYIFEQQQEIRFEVIDVDNAEVTSFDYIGHAETTIGALVGAKNSTQILDLVDKQQKKGGKIILRCDKVQNSSEVGNFELIGKSIRNTRWNKEGGNASYLIHQTEVVKHNLNPVYKIISFNLGKLCSGDHYQPIKIELWDYHSNGSHKFMGEMTFTIDELETQNKRQFNIVSPKNNQSMGTLIFKSFKIEIKPQFLDYIRGGTQLALITAIDFTSSNGYPNYLHSYNCPGGMNSYQKAIKAVGEILMNYDYDKLVPVFGFGGKPKMSTLASYTVMHCFPLNGNTENPDVFGIEGIMEAYDYSLHNTELSGPTLFYPIIRQVMNECEEWKSENNQQYAILLILTDGCIHDMDQTKAALVDCAFLPLSIIIVGIGNADFTNMEILDGDDGLWDSKGRKAQRDLVQFVPFNKFGGDPIKLAEEVLEELPRQLVEYMTSVKKYPLPPQQFDINNMLLNRENSIPVRDNPANLPIGYHKEDYQQQQQNIYQRKNTGEQNFGINQLKQQQQQGLYRQTTMPSNYQFNMYGPVPMQQQQQLNYQFDVQSARVMGQKQNNQMGFGI